MIDRDTTQQLKALPMADYLAYRGYQPVSQRGGRLLYHSPLRAESTPSFWVDPTLNRYKDFGENEKGDDLIRLVQQIDNCSFADAVRTLTDYAGLPQKPSFSLIGQSSTPTQPALTGHHEIQAVKLLANRALVRYAESRGIPYPLARLYLREVYYSYQTKNFFALGLCNDSDGYALRSQLERSKINIGPADITSVAGVNQRAVNVFEGMFDFLSALVYYGLTVPNCPTIILNSTGNLAKARPVLSAYPCINAYFDRDPPGQNALATLVAANLTVVDRSGLYEGYTDFNAFLMATRPVFVT